MCQIKLSFVICHKLKGPFLQAGGRGAEVHECAGHVVLADVHEDVARDDIAVDLSVAQIRRLGTVCSI